MLSPSVPSPKISLRGRLLVRFFREISGLAGFLKPLRRHPALSIALLYCHGISTSADTGQSIAELPELQVTAGRSPTPRSQSPYAINTLDRSALQSLPQRRLDDALRSIPGFSLFRRSSSRVAHPTTQGVSLRNLGPNGAGRTLVLHDGIPLNDPFGGWVYWNRFSIAIIDHIELQRGGGSGPWGNAALAGVIHLFSKRPEGDSAFFEASGGNRGTYEFTATAQKTHDDASVFITASRFSTDGYPILREDQRGSIDRNAFSASDFLQGGIEWSFGERTSLVFRASYLNEDRGNGTPLATNHTEAYDASISLNHNNDDTGLSWRAQFYYQNRDFRNQFTSVRADRTSENPALEQFDVPAESWGGSAIIRFDVGETHRLLGGVDARFVEGETNERFFYSAGSFNRQRRAGGTQALFGFFLEDSWDVANSLTLTFGGRLDYWRIGEGIRRQIDLVTGNIRRDDTFPEREEWIGNFRFGLNYQPHDKVRARAAFYTGFRAPTLNELYRPFRVRVDITEANPQLERERLYGGEFGVSWRPSETTGFNITFFINALNNAIANVTLAPGPGFVQPCGFVPNGGTCRQRRNLGQARVAGLELDATWDFSEHLQLSASYLYSHAVITDSPDLNALEDNRMAQAPDHQFNLNLRWIPNEKWRYSLQVRFTSSQFEDDLNSRELDAFAVVDLSSAYAINDHLEAFLTLENLFDTEFEIGIASNGLVSIGAPRLVSAGLRWRM